MRRLPGGAGVWMPAYDGAANRSVAALRVAADADAVGHLHGDVLRSSFYFGLIAAALVVAAMLFFVGAYVWLVARAVGAV